MEFEDSTPNSHFSGLLAADALGPVFNNYPCWRYTWTVVLQFTWITFQYMPWRAWWTCQRYSICDVLICLFPAQICEGDGAQRVWRCWGWQRRCHDLSQCHEHQQHHHHGDLRQDSSAAWPPNQPAAVSAEDSPQSIMEAPVLLALPPACGCQQTQSARKLHSSMLAGNKVD